MSPEQALGKDVDARTDLFSLGVVLYELATGRLPFVGNTATQTIDQICHATPAEIGASRKDVPAELERIVKKCLEKDRDQRHTSARDIVVDLRNLERDRASGTSPVVVPPRGGTRRFVLVGTAALVAALAVGAGLLYRGAASGAASGSLAVLPFENATRQRRPRGLPPVSQGARLPGGQPAGDGQERRLPAAGRGARA